MSEQAEATSEAPSEAPAQEAPQQTEQQPKGDYAPRVDLSGIADDATREAVEARLAHMSRLIKKTERRGEMTLKEYRDIASQQAKVIEELQGGMGAVVDHLQTQTFAQTEAQLKAQLRQARDNGDTDAELEIQDRLLEVKAKKLSTPKLDRPKKNETQQQAYAGTPSAMQLADDAVQDGDITDEDLGYIEQWTKEADTNGAILRPWSVNRGTEQQPDPQYIAGLLEARSVFSNPRYANLSIDKKLAEVDRRMGVESKQNGQAVLGGGFTPRKNSVNVKTSPQQDRIAVKTKYAGAGKTDAEHIAAYRAQITKVNASKGAR